MGLTSSKWQQVKGTGKWSMDLNLAKQIPLFEIAEYARFSKVLQQLNSPQLVNMAWNKANGVWEWEIDGWNWPWDESEGKDNEASGYGTGFRRDRDDGDSRIPCHHDWVNVSFAHVHMACRHCGVDKPE